MTEEQIIAKGDDLLQSKDLDKRIFQRIIVYIGQHTEGGIVNISDEDLALIDDIIYDEVKKSDYQENITSYLKLIDQLDKAVSKTQGRVNRLKLDDINDLWNNSERRQQIIDKVVSDLGGQGVKENFIKKISDTVRDVNFYNLTVKDAVKTFETLLIEKEYSNSYLKAVATDTLSQYAGAFHDEVRKTYGFKDLIYSGRDIETTRPICHLIHSKYGGKLTGDQLDAILKEYCPNGEPSETMIEYDTVSGKKYKKKKGAGMIKGTRKENFAQLRGGYQCRHVAIWTTLREKS